MKNAVLILAGGTSKRIGQDKASLEYKGKTFLDILIESFHDADIAIASNDERHHRDGCVLLADKPGFVGPLAGILSGIEYFKRDHIFVVSVDTPFVNQMVMKSSFNLQKVIKLLLQELIIDRYTRLDGIRKISQIRYLQIWH